MDNKLIELIAEYLAGEISEQKQNELDVLVKETGTDLNALLEIYHNLSGINVPEASSNMDDTFYNMLQKEKRALSNKNSFFTHLKVKLMELVSMPAVPRFRNPDLS